MHSAETGFYYLQSRYYDPAIGRFINADDAGNLAANGDFASHNLYAYCGNNPVARQDDGGEAWHIAIGAVVGAVVNVAVSYTLNTIAGNGYSWRDGLIDFATGAASGALAASGFGMVAQVVGNGLIGVGGTALNSQLNNEKATLGDYLNSFAVGAFSGYIGGKGLASDIKVAKQLSIIDSNFHCVIKPNPNQAAWNSIKTSAKRIGGNVWDTITSFANASALANSVASINRGNRVMSNA